MCDPQSRLWLWLGSYTSMPRCFRCFVSCRFSLAPGMPASPLLWRRCSRSGRAALCLWPTAWLLGHGLAMCYAASCVYVCVCVCAARPSHRQTSCRSSSWPSRRSHRKCRCCCNKTICGPWTTFFLSSSTWCCVHGGPHTLKLQHFNIVQDSVISGDALMPLFYSTTYCISALIDAWCL